MGTPSPLTKSISSERIVISISCPTFSNVPLPFLYDPLTTAWLNERIDAICANVRQSILSQAEVAEPGRS